MKEARGGDRRAEELIYLITTATHEEQMAGTVEQARDELASLGINPDEAWNLMGNTTEWLNRLLGKDR